LVFDLEKVNTLIVRVVDSQKNKPVQNVNVKVFKFEKDPITPLQWAENLRNGSPFKTLKFSMGTDENGKVKAEFAEGTYEVKVESYGFSEVYELFQDVEIIVVKPKKHWWQ
jgi:hypothetical protein